MKIYLDLVLLINFFFDFILLMSVGIILKRKINIKYIFLGAFIGSLSILILFFNIPNFLLFILKIIFSILMLLVAYPKGDLRYQFYNLIIFYITSIFLGGCLYMLNINMNYNHVGIIFIHNGISINFIVLLLLSPIIIYLYIKNTQMIKNKYNNYYLTKIKISNHEITGTGYIDSGNNLSFKGKPIILIDKRKVIFLNEGYRIIPYKVVNKILMLKIYKCEEVIINNKVIKNIYLGLSDEKFNIDGVDILLNNKLMEDL